MTCRVLIVGVAPAAGCAEGKTWRAAAGLVHSRLVQRFGSGVVFEYVDLFSAEMSARSEVEAALAAGAVPPIVLIDGAVHASGGKLQVSAIEREVAERLATVPVSPAKDRVS